MNTTRTRPLVLLIAASIVMVPGMRIASPAHAAPAAQTATPNPAAPHEIVGMRTRTADTSVLPDGQYQTTIYPGPINYQDASGAWQPIDNALVPSSRPGYAYQNSANAYTVSLPQNLSDAPIRLDAGTAWVTFL
jgi:hypothetical protein